MVKKIINLIVLMLFLIFLFVVIKESGNFLDVFNPLTLYFILILIHINLYNVKLRTVAKRKSPVGKYPKTEEFSLEYFSNSTNSFILMMISVLLFSFSILLLASGFSWGVIIFALTLLIASILFIVSALNPQKVIFSNSGIEYQSLLLDYECEWTDILEIARFYSRGDAIVLEKVTFKKSFLPRSYFDYKLPLSSFDASWEQRVLGRIIKQNVPFLEFWNN